MTKPMARLPKETPTSKSRSSPLTDRLNSRVLQTIKDLATKVDKTFELDDTYGAEIFEGIVGRSFEQKKKK